ncbi:MAG: nitroreductase family protein [Candidatus Lokiarchaeota archaeon]|nr:nitroreductase family protein [Candidatus Lokiarchaeota archaeon]
MNVQDVIKERRAYRSLDFIEITNDLIIDLAEKAQIAPSCANKQPWNFIFVKEKDQLNRLFSTLSEGNKWVEKTSMIIAVFSKPENDCIIGERQYFLFDTGLATAFIILRATELGLVAHPIAGFKEDQAKKILEIPEEMRLITLVIIGKHSKDINPVLSEAMKLGEKQRPPRKKLEDFVYLNTFNNNFHENEGNV